MSDCCSVRAHEIEALQDMIHARQQRLRVLKEKMQLLERFSSKEGGKNGKEETMTVQRISPINSPLKRSPKTNQVNVRLVASRQGVILTWLGNGEKKL